MRVENSIKRIIRNHIIAFVLIVLLQILSTVLMSWIANIFLAETTLLAEGQREIKTAIFALLGSIFVILDLVFLCSKVFAMISLSKQEPIKARIEDIFFVGYTDDGRKKYNAYPIVRSLDGDQLFLTYGKYAMARFNAKIVYMNNSIMEAELSRGYNKTLGIGDVVEVYISKVITKTVKVDVDFVTIGRQRLPFIHQNQHISIKDMHTVTVFKGVVA